MNECTWDNVLWVRPCARCCVSTWCAVSLALHRIRKAQVSTLSFERPKEFDLAQYDGDGRFGFGYGEKVHLSNWV